MHRLILGALALLPLMPGAAIAQTPPEPGVLSAEEMVPVVLIEEEGVTAIASQEYVVGYDAEGNLYVTRAFVYDFEASSMATTEQINCSSSSFRYVASPILLLNGAEVPLDNMFTGEWEEAQEGTIRDLVFEIACQEAISQ